MTTQFELIPPKVRTWYYVRGHTTCALLSPPILTSTKSRKSFAQRHLFSDVLNTRAFLCCMLSEAFCFYWHALPQGSRVPHPIVIIRKTPKFAINSIGFRMKSHSSRGLTYIFVPNIYFRGSTWISATQGDDHISLPTYTEGFLGMKPSLLYVGVHGRPGGKYSLGVSIVDVGDREMAAHMPIKRHPK